MKLRKVSYYSTFSGQKVKFDKDLFTGADLTTVFAGMEKNKNRFQRLRSCIYMRNMVSLFWYLFLGVASCTIL